MAASKSFTMYECEDYECRLEYNRDVLIVHLPAVYKFNRSVLISMQIKLEDIYDFSVGLGYPSLHCAVPIGNTKVARLAEICGFVFFANHDGFSVYKYKGI